VKQNRFPPGWDEKRARRVLAHHEEQTEAEAGQLVVVGGPVDRLVVDVGLDEGASSAAPTRELNLAEKLPEDLFVALGLHLDGHIPCSSTGSSHSVDRASQGGHLAVRGRVGERWSPDLRGAIKDLGDVQAGSPTSLQLRTEEHKEGRLCAIPSSRNLVTPEGVQAPEEVFQPGEG
jgi:hypothetical protein